MARPTCRGYVARGRGEVHPAFRTSDLVLIRELLLSLVELLLLPFQSFQSREFLLIPELLLLLQLQPGLLLAHLFEFVPWGVGVSVAKSLMGFRSPGELWLQSSGRCPGSPQVPQGARSGW